MSIRESVAYLAEILEKQARDIEPRLLSTIHAISAIQSSEFDNALDEWEDSVMAIDVPCDMSSRAELLNDAIQSVFDLGRCNMYSEYSEEKARNAYRQAIDCINEMYLIKRKYKKFDFSRY